MSGQQQTDKRVWFGLILVVIGGFWLLDNLDIIPYYIPHYLISWKTFLIVLGAYFIFGKNKPEPGIIMVGIGSIFLLQDFDLFRVRDIWHIFWPLAIILVGISLIVRRGGGFGKGARDEKKNNIDYLDDTAIFGGGERKIDSQEFKGGKITAIFGGSDIDFRSANLSEGENVLDIFVMFGGTDIKVPPDWTIEVDVFALFGGFSDNRSSALKVVPDKTKVLRVKGFVMFGGGDIKL
ncbi:hypothetical protein E1176_15275 [Fulvivirga sp. RKSG066]|uniref:LiaF transmembrane domain-containing protein n=1 Tax=Fulvivirga aurantia TaxID=2529383 RepID=UPI0012BD66B7|nr:DUF5668 domain-containing protein [Fulvivirga aurantia]MTI22392.1 hypothetical protein [Fulvivirga aurantia]